MPSPPSPSEKTRRQVRRAVDTLGRQVFREVFPDVAPDAPLRRRRLRGTGWHRIEVLSTVRKPERRLVLKVVPPPHVESSRDAERHAHMMATEHRVLAEVGPRISEQNPATRCPRVLAYRPASGLLALEAVDGPTLDSVLFGLAPTGGRRELIRLLELCGEWLARFHALTRTEEEGHPFEWLLEEFTLPAVRAVFERDDETPTWAGLCGMARELRDAYPTVRRAKCAIHGVFAPYHVLVRDGRIYVIDLESSRVGYPYEDLALFHAYYDLRLPWETALATRRQPIEQQCRAFLRGYARNTQPFDDTDELVLRLARFHALIRFPLEWERQGQRSSPKSWLRWRWWWRRFHAVYREELGALRQAARRGVRS